MSELLIASFMFNLLNYYFLIAVVKTINIALLKTKFKLILNSQNFNQLDNIISINSRKIRLYFIYEYYIYYGLVFQNVSIYEYFQYIVIIK